MTLECQSAAADIIHLKHIFHCYTSAFFFTSLCVSLAKRLRPPPTHPTAFRLRSGVLPHQRGQTGMGGARLPLQLRMPRCRTQPVCVKFQSFLTGSKRLIHLILPNNEPHAFRCSFLYLFWSVSDFLGGGYCICTLAM